MKKITLLGLLCTVLYAEQAPQQTTIQTSFESLQFDNSKKKDTGKRASIRIGYKEAESFYQLAYERTNTDTFKPPLTKDLHVNRYTLKYTRILDKKQSVNVSYRTIDDNIMKETNSGHIYGVGYRYGPASITQYLSDYKHFNVYQTDLTYNIKHNYAGAQIKFTLIAKYLHLSDKDSNGFSKNAQENYLTPGIKIHAQHHGYSVGAGAFFGKRIFAVMDNGFQVQHHAMEFKETYMLGLGKQFGKINAKLRYVYQMAEEIPIHNDNVEVQNLALQLRYAF